MSVLQYSTKRNLQCPATGCDAPTNQIAVYPFWEGMGKVVVWWFCGHCDDWHLLLYTQSPLNPPTPSHLSMPRHLN